MSFFNRKNKAERTDPVAPKTKVTVESDASTSNEFEVIVKSRTSRKRKQRIFITAVALITIMIICFWIVPHVQKSITNNQTSDISADSTQVKTTDTTQNQNNQTNAKLSVKNNQPEKLADKVADTASVAAVKKVIPDSSKQLKAKTTPNKKTLPIKAKAQTKKKSVPKKETIDNESIKKAIQTSNFLSKEKKAKLFNHYGIKQEKVR
ncbi:MAG: hypothetical protein PHR00_01960 [Patescibacteria group bacterium]|nr:hypothetical protein [Patescibacteria group bacterium]